MDLSYRRRDSRSRSHDSRSHRSQSDNSHRLDRLDRLSHINDRISHRRVPISRRINISPDRVDLMRRLDDWNQRRRDFTKRFEHWAENRRDWSQIRNQRETYVSPTRSNRQERNNHREHSRSDNRMRNIQLVTRRRQPTKKQLFAYHSKIQKLQILRRSASRSL